MAKELKTALSDEEAKFFGPERAAEANKMLAANPEPVFTSLTNVDEETGIRSTRGKQPRTGHEDPAAGEEPPEPVTPPAENKPQQPAPAAAEEDEDDAIEVEQGDGKKTRMVPHGALHDERTKRKNVENENAELKRQMDALRNSLPQQQPAAQPVQPAQPATQAPTLETDPVAYIEDVAATAKKALQTIADRDQADNFRSGIQQIERAFVAENPDYSEAVKFLKRNRFNELKALGYDDQAAGNFITQETQAIALQAIQNRQNPAAVAYNMAKVRGYVKPAPAPAADAVEAPSGEDRRAVAQTRAGRSLSNNSGGAVNKAGKIGIAEFMRMDSKEIAERAASDPNFMKTFGGAA